MIPLHGWTIDWFGHDSDHGWGTLREAVVPTKDAIESGVRVHIAEALAKTVYECYLIAARFDLKLDEAVRELHRSNLDMLTDDELLRNRNGSIRPRKGHRQPNWKKAV